MKSLFRVLSIFLGLIFWGFNSGTMEARVLVTPHNPVHPPATKPLTTYYFTATGDWTDATKWLPSYPGETIAAGDMVMIDPSVSVTIPTGVTVTINGYLLNDAGSFLYNEGTLEYAGTVENIGQVVNKSGAAWNGAGASSSFINYNIFLNEGNITIDLESVLENDGGALYNQGSIFIKGNSTFKNGGASNSGSFVNGTFTVPITPGSVSIDDGTFENTTAFNNNEMSSVNVEANGVLQVSGGFFNNTNASLYNNGEIVDATGLLENNGAYIGVGTFTGSFTNRQDGIVIPGQPVGCPLFEGDYTNEASSSLYIDLGGTTACTDLDQIHINGNAVIDGELSLSFYGGHVPSMTTSYTILTATGSIAGEFNPIQYPPSPCNVSWNIAYNANSIVVTATVDATAMPTAYNVTGGGVFCAGGAGVSVGLSDSDMGVDYQLQLDGSDVGAPVSGTGDPLDFGLKTGVGDYTVVATNTASGCTADMTGTATVSRNERITDITASGFTFCNGNDTYSGGDDYSPGSVTVHFSSIPASGTLDLSSPDLIGSPLMVDVSSLGGTSYSFSTAKIKATGASVNFSAVFSADNCTFSKNNVLTAPQQCSRHVFTGTGNWDVASNWQNNNPPSSIGSFRHITVANGASAVMPSSLYVFGNADSMFVAPNGMLNIQSSASFSKGSSNTGVAFVNKGTVSLTGSDGSLTLTNMALYNDGTFTINGSSTGLYLSGSDSKLFNKGTITNMKYVQAYADVTNLAGGVINSTANIYFAVGAFTNAGTFTHNWPGNTIQCFADINNSGTFTLEAGSSLEVYGSYFTNSGTVNNKGSLLPQYTPSFTNTPTGTINNTGTMTLRNGMAQNGIFNNESSGNLIIESYSPVFENNGVLTNDGTLDQTEGATFRNNNVVWHNGTINCSAFSALFDNVDSLVAASGSVINITGGNFEFKNASTGTFVLNGTMTAANLYSNQFVNDGILKGSGTLTNSMGKVLTNSATGSIQPGTSPGTLTINQLNTIGTVNIEIGGATPGTGYDVLNLPTDVVLDGTLNVTLINNFQPACGDIFDIITYASATGTFATVNLPPGFSIAYLSDKVRLTYGSGTCSITAISIGNMGGCNNNNTNTASDDYFVAGDIAVVFAFPPSSGNLVIKRGSTVLGTKAASELACLTEWLFLNVQMVADGQPLAITAEFSSTNCSLTQTHGNAPGSCSCVPTTAFTTCPTVQPVNVAANSCAATVNYNAVANGTPAPTYTYAFSGATTTAGAQNGTGSGSSFNAGQTTVTLTATNDCGSTTCSFTVTVVDNIPPTIACPNNITANMAAGTCGATITYNLPVGADNCGILGYDLLEGPLSGTTANGGTTLVRWMVTDDHNNTATCTFNVVVTDNIPPSITCPNPISLPTAPNLCGANASWTAPVGIDNCPNVNTSGSHTPGSFFAKGQTTVTYTTTDGAGRSSACSFTITVGDSQAPTLVCPASATRPNTPGQCGAVVTYDPVVTENCPGTTVTVQSGLASGATFPIGTTIVTLLATDGSALTNTCSFTVTVQDTEKPAITCPGSIVRNTDAGQCSAVVTYTNPNYTDNCPPGGNAGLDHLEGGLSGSTFQKGTTTVKWMATDAANLTATCTFTITVTDAQAPTLTCPPNQNANTDLGACTATVSYPTPAASDNCTLPNGQLVWVSGGAAPTASGANQTASFAKGLTTVQWRVTDGAGLTRTCTFRVVVNDREKPTLTCPSAIQANTAAGTCTAVVTYAAPSFSDNCAPTTGTAVRTSGSPSGSALPAGNSTVVFRATDAAGSTSTCSMQITVVDNQTPVVACPASTTVSGSGTPCSAQVFYAAASASDNCSGTLTPFLVSGLGNGSLFPAGTTVNTFRAVATNGQTGECTFSVTVNCPSAKPGNGNTTNNIQTVTPLSLYPNPANATVWADFGAIGASGGLLTVFDALGRAVWQRQLAEGQNQAIVEDLRNWPSGVYVVVLKTEQQSVAKQLVVE